MTTSYCNRSRNKKNSENSSYLELTDVCEQQCNSDEDGGCLHQSWIHLEADVALDMRTTHHCCLALGACGQRGV